MTIQDALSRITTFEEFLPITEMARAQVSSLGDWFVVVEGYIGSLQIADLVNKVEELIMRRPPWNREIQRLGTDSCRQIDRVYSQLFEKEAGLQGKTKDFNKKKKTL